MNEPKVTDLNYINFLVASPLVLTCTEAGRGQPAAPQRAAHAALTRLLHRLAPDSTPRWEAAQQHVVLHAGLLIVDDTTLDTPYAQTSDLVHRQWSGNQQRVVSGSNLGTLLWRDGTDAIPGAYRRSDQPVDGVTKHAHVRALLAEAKARGFQPRLVAFDCWDSSLEHLKTIRSYGWQGVTRRKRNRHVNPAGPGQRALQECAIAPDGTVVHLKGDGLILVFRIDPPDGDTEDWATSVLTMTSLERERVAGRIWTIEVKWIIAGSSSSVA